MLLSHNSSFASEAVIVIGDVHQCSPMFKLLLDVHRCSPVFFNGELASASWSVGELTVISACT